MLSKRIKELRLLNGFTQKDLSDKLGLTPKMVSFYELGDRVPPPDVLEKLADIFNVTTDYLFGRAPYTECSHCYRKYDPLNAYESSEHDEFHKRYLHAKSKCKNLISAWDASNLRDKSINNFRKRGISIEERVVAYSDYLKYDYVLYLWKNGLNPDLEDFDTYCKKDIILAETKDACNELDLGLYPELIKKYDADASEIAHVRDEELKAIIQPELKVDEIRFIQKYRNLDPHGKEMVDMVLDKEHERCLELKKASGNIISIEKPAETEEPDRSYLMPVAAHDDYIDEEGEMEKVLEDLKKLQRPK